MSRVSGLGAGHEAGLSTERSHPASGLGCARAPPALLEVCAASEGACTTSCIAGGVSMQCTRFYLYFAAILEFVEKPGAGRLLSDQGRDGGVRLISPAFGLRTFVALLLSGVTFFPVQKQCGIL